jgi:hypothetical protein
MKEHLGEQMPAFDVSNMGKDDVLSLTSPRLAPDSFMKHMDTTFEVFFHKRAYN